MDICMDICIYGYLFNKHTYISYSAGSSQSVLGAAGDLDKD